MLIPVATQTTAVEAHIVRGLLEAQGIPAFVLYEHHVTAVWNYSLALGGVRVAVPHQCLEDATAVLEGFGRGDYSDALEALEGTSEPIDCAACGSIDTSSANFSRKLALASVFLLYVPLPYTNHRLRCKSCGNVWVNAQSRSPSLFVRFAAAGLLILGVFALLQVWVSWCEKNCAEPYKYYYQQ